MVTVPSNCDPNKLFFFPFLLDASYELYGHGDKKGS